ncbi:RING finger and transmembrane domain-containing protein 2-like isoform X2 [Macrobrachium nipponense]|uniref:RING finger and transmembrane domain-containing protein 2-like isoform X2 n=1 Tax=Macrobrachium nipponense TaxID=159736 RepID=UPI0030C82970
MQSMAGHGRRILASEEQERTGRSVLPISLTGRFHSNTWRQVFTSLRPFVAQTRQRTLSTYARRLHQRHLDGQTQNSVLESVPLVSDQAADSNPWQQQHSHHPSGLHVDDSQQEVPSSGQNVVIDIETSTRGTGIPPNTSSIPVHQDAENDSAFTSVTNTSHSSHAPANGSDDSSAVASSIDPLIPREAPSTSLSESDNASYSDTSSDDGATSGTNNRSASDSLSDLLNQFPEVRSVLVVAWHYCIFFLIILAKAVFDHFAGLLVLLTLVIGFVWSNNILKKSIARQGRRSVKPLLALLVNIPAGVFLLCYSYRSDKLINTVLLIHPDRDGFGVLDLLWIVIVSDYILKLVTVLLKTFVTILPHSLMHYQNRGKYFLVIEMVSQLYRSLIPIQPWLSYLLGYSGPKILIGVILTATYLVCKGPDVVVRMKSLHDAVDKFIHNISYRSTPTKAQLQDAGVCPICHDDFQLPTMLQCKHIFCEQCVVTWLDHEQTCPMCRTQVADDPAWRDGGTSHFLQLY